MNRLPIQLASRSGSFWFGMSLPWRALKLILAHRNLMFWSALPVLLTLSLYGLVIVRVQNWAQTSITEYLISHGIAAESWTLAAIMFLAKIGLWVIAAVSFSFSATLISAPLNDFLAETSEKYATPSLPPFSQTSLKAKVRLLLIDMGKTLAATGAAILTFFLAWIPVVNVAAFFLTCVLICFQYTSYPQTRRGVGIKDGVRFLFQYFYSCLGFGMVLIALFSVPFFSCFMLPLAVVGGTLLVARAQKIPELPLLR